MALLRSACRNELLDEVDMLAPTAKARANQQLDETLARLGGGPGGAGSLERLGLELATLP